MGFLEWLKGEEDMKGNPIVPLTKDKRNWCLKCKRILLTKGEQKDNICKDCINEEDD